MPVVPDSRLKGNYGAAIVMGRLSGDCLVRPVAADTDVGVDLYCETLDDERRPFLHFWIQVKSGEQCKVDPARAVASCSFERDKLEYWSRQPVPVFAALVPTEWPAQGNPDIYIVDVTTYVLFTGLPREESKSLCSEHHWPAGDNDCVRRFLTDVVPKTTARLQCSRGVVAASPTSAPQYVQSTPFVPVIQFKERIQNQLRTTAACSIQFAVLETKTDATEFRRLLAHILEQFGDDSHWETFMARALSSHVDQDFENALALYGIAKHRIQNDPNVCNDPSWQATVRHIEQQETRARDQKPPV